MKKYTLIFLLFIQTLVSSQDLRFGVISSPEVGNSENEAKINSAIQILNSNENIDFTIITGNISQNGKNSELEKAKEILGNLKSEYFIIPGRTDSRFSESGLTKFLEVFRDNRFTFEKDSSVFIGINSSFNRQTDGHIKPEDEKWLKEILAEKDSTSSIYFFVFHNPKTEIDNWFKVSNLLVRFKKSVIFYGSESEYKIDKINNIPLISIPQIGSNKNESVNIFEARNDSLFSFEADLKNKKLLNKISINKKNKPELINSKSFENYEAEILWDFDLKFTMEAELLTAGDFVYACDRAGLITCLDSTGNVVWEYDSFGTTINTPVVADGIFAAATLQGDLLTLNAETGESLQTIGFDDVITSPLITIEYSGSTNFLIPKQTESKAAVVLGTASGKLYCYDLETLQQIWVYEKAKGMIAAKPAFKENKIIFPAFDKSLYCIDARRGTLIWKWNGIDKNDEFPVLCNPVTNDENVYLVTNGGNTFAVDLLLGKTVWENGKLNAYESIGISEIGHRLFIKSEEDKFHIISAKTSYWVKEINLRYGEDRTNAEPIEYNGNVIFGAKDGNVYLIDEKFKSKKLFFMGTAAVHTIKHFRDNIFAASNIDGKIVLFSFEK